MTHQGVEIENFAPIGAPLENDGNRGVGFSGLGERQYFGELIDERAGEVCEPELAHRPHGWARGIR